MKIWTKEGLRKIDLLARALTTRWLQPWHHNQFFSSYPTSVAKSKGNKKKEIVERNVLLLSVIIAVNFLVAFEKMQTKKTNVYRDVTTYASLKQYKRILN